MSHSRNISCRFCDRTIPDVGQGPVCYDCLRDRNNRPLIGCPTDRLEAHAAAQAAEKLVEDLEKLEVPS